MERVPRTVQLPGTPPAGYLGQLHKTVHEVLNRHARALAEVPGLIDEIVADVAAINRMRFEAGNIASLTTGNAYGSLYASTATSVNFAQAFTAAPLVVCYPSTAQGFVSYYVSFIGLSSFSAGAIGVTNGGTASMGWRAIGY